MCAYLCVCEWMYDCILSHAIRLKTLHNTWQATTATPTPTKRTRREVYGRLLCVYISSFWKSREENTQNCRMFTITEESFAKMRWWNEEFNWIQHPHTQHTFAFTYIHFYREDKEKCEREVLCLLNDHNRNKNSFIHFECKHLDNL